MLRLGAMFLRHAAPTELKKIIECPRFYKHAAPPELNPSGENHDSAGSARLWEGGLESGCRRLLSSLAISHQLLMCPSPSSHPLSAKLPASLGLEFNE